MRFVLAQVIDLLHRVLRWWLAELAALMPDGLRAALAPKTEALVVEPAETGFTVSRLSGSRRQELACLPYPGQQAAGMRAPSLPPLARRQLASADEIALRLPPETALRKTVSLPLGAEANLHEILYFELDRQTPFRPDEVYFDHRVIERLPGSQRVMVELTVLARAAVDPILAWLARWGLEPGRVEAAGDDGDVWTCRLPARDEGGDRPAFVRFVNPGLAALAVVLAALAVYAPIQRQEAVLADLQAELAVEQRRAADTLELRETLAALSDQALHLVNKKRENAPVLEIWNEATRILPDHSYALELRLRERQVELVGQSAAATGLLEVIESSPLFHRVTFRSPITRGQGSEAERFHLAFEVGPREPGRGAER